MKPHFFWVGQGKSGSSLAHRVLARHPQVYLGAQKEHDLFMRPVSTQAALDYYADASRGISVGQIFGDISPSYHMRPARINRIVSFYKDEPIPKILFCLRNPLSFAVSRYHQVIKIGKFLEGAQPFPTTIDDFVNAKMLGKFTLLRNLRHTTRQLGGPDNICLLSFEEDFRGDYDFEPKIQRALGLDATQRYYNPATDAEVNAGLRPWFVLPQPKAQNIDLGGHVLHLPADAAAFCSTPARSRIIPAPDRAMIARMAKANDDWAVPLSQSMQDRITEAITRPVRKYVARTYGLKLRSWDIVPPIKSYPRAVPPVTAFNPSPLHPE